MKPAKLTLCLLLSTPFGLDACTANRDGQGAAHSSEITRAQPDPSTWIAIEPPLGFRERADIADRFGAARLFEVAGGRVVLSFVARTDADGAQDLKAFAKAQDALFLELVGSRDIAALDLGEAAQPFVEAKVQHLARAYVNRENSDSICDAAAVRFETPGGFWTLSWNAAIGDLDAATERMGELLRALRLDRR